MQRLLQFLFQYRIFILFVIIEGICFWIIVSNNNYQGAKFLNASNSISASVVHTADNVENYFDLKNQNSLLAEENIRLRQYLLQYTDSTVLSGIEQDSLPKGIKAKVIDNSLFFRNNYLIVNRGSDDGVQKGMGVIGPDGVVGQVQNISSKYATVTSLLHSRTLISSKHQKSGTLCSVTWPGENSQQSKAEYLPRHIKVSVGDSILTSGYNTVYPEGTMVGIVDNVSIGPDETFYTVTIDLSTNFSNLSYVYLLQLKDKVEIDSLRDLNLRNDG
ncbi:MAG: rod shape-determining protein MreC [Reichenbachiella sp.]